MEGHLVTKNSPKYPWMDNYLMVTGSLVVELTFVKCHQRLVVYPGVNPSLAWKKADLFVLLVTLFIFV